MSASPSGGGDRYEPLPSIPELPRYLWRRLPKPARIGLALLALTGVVAIVLLAPHIDSSKDERSRAETRRLEQARAQRLARLRVEQAPRLARSGALAPAGASPAARRAGRERALAAASAAILRDARARGLHGPIRRVVCGPFPRSVSASGAERDLTRRTGRYECLAVTAEVAGAPTQGKGVIGHAYRLQLDFVSGRYAFCKVAGRAGEGSIGRSHSIVVPRACGGR